MTAGNPSSDVRPTFTWILLLAGPVVWYAYFWLVYLGVETGCRIAGSNSGTLGVSHLSLFTLALTAAAFLMILVAGIRNYRAWRSAERAIGLPFAGLVLSVIFAMSVLATGLPALVLPPC
jgi:glucan phosphoethanolaminetransferase (alkaline phosphatase superfamily)